MRLYGPVAKSGEVACGGCTKMNVETCKLADIPGVIFVTVTKLVQVTFALTEQLACLRHGAVLLAAELQEPGEQLSRDVPH